LGHERLHPGGGDYFKVRILIAPDKFKGSLSAREVAESIALGLHDVLSEATIDVLPLADGGEGTAEVISAALCGSWVQCGAHDPLGRKIDARYAWIDEQKLAVMEMSEAAGMRRLSENERDPMHASTFGVGEMMRDAMQRGAREMIIGLGGSATNDGGWGMARAIGFRFFAGAKELTGAVSELAKLTEVSLPGELAEPPGSGTESKNRRLGQPPQQRALSRITAAVDVINPLLGTSGATRVYGPQKGANGEQLQVLEMALRKLADVVAEDLGVDFRDQPGAGAAGGLGFGLMSFCRAKVRPGFDVVAEALDLERKIRNVDVVITGEGKLDNQTLSGKTPAGVACLAGKLGKRVFAIVGCASGDREARKMFEGVYELGGQISESPKLLRKKAQELASGL
jgi:glycerate 2-kinase